MMKQLRNSYTTAGWKAVLLILCLLSWSVYGDTTPSTRSGVGAIPYAGGTTFRVWAPNASWVNVAGSFNGWNSSSKPLGSEGGGWWSRDVTGALAGQEYRYVIEGTTPWKTDPRANDVVSSVGNGIIVDTSYNWTSFTPPAWNEMVIYEMHIGTYNDTPGGSPGTWVSAESKLDHIESLGANVVKIMPVAEFPGDYSMGYNPVNLYAPESAYGSPDQMRHFIDACHQHGIAVIIDVVYNHMGPSDLGNSLWQFDGYSAAPDTGGIYFFEDDNRYTPWGDTRPNYTMGEVRSFIRDNVMYWLNEFNMDGIRMDGTAYIRQRDTVDGPVDVPGGWSLMQWINNEIDAAHQQKISIAEDMRDDEWLTKTTGEGGAGFDSQWDARFHHKVVPVLETPDDVNRNMWDIRDAVTHLYNGWDTQRVIYTESHDEVGLASGKSRVPSRIWWDNPDSYYSKKRSTLGAGLVFTSPGIPMLFMGQEFLEDGSWHDDDPLDWSKDTDFAGIKQMYTHLIQLRRNLTHHTRGLLGKNVNVFHVNNTDKVIAFHRWMNGGPGDDVVVVANFSNQRFTSYTIGMPRGGRWRVRFNSDWAGYDPEFDNWNAYDTLASADAKDGLLYQANVGIGRYSMIILSQGTTPDIDGSGDVNLDDLALFARQWQNSCDPWDACAGVDFDLSGAVDMTDLAAFITRWLDGLP